jgi:4'-phosphopantetheinyl transferase
MDKLLWSESMSPASASRQPVVRMGRERELAPFDLDVWYQPIHDPLAGDVDGWLAVLSDAEKQRYQRFAFAKDRIHFAAAHALLRGVLSQYADIVPEEWQFSLNKWGKPAIANEGIANIEFNLTHTQGLVACAVVRSTSIGIDAEWTGRSVQLDSLARACFAPEEVAYFLSTPEEKQREVFFRLWTLKESYIKARGRGLSIALDSFSFALNPTDVTIRFASTEADANGWSFFEYQPTPEHHLAVAVPCSGSWNVNFRRVTQHTH